MEALRIVELFREVASAIQSQIHTVSDWGLSGARPGQYTIDVAADEIALTMLHEAGFAVLSEESGITYPDRDLVAVIDPIDGSTNASAGLPWFATSLCAVDADGPVAAVVVNQATGDTWHAIRDGGACKNDVAIRPSGVTELSETFLAVNGLPERHLGWRQFRCYGAAALDICAVADGTFDAYADLATNAHGVWDYLGALLICREAGGVVVDLEDRDLVLRSHTERRTPFAAATPALLAELRQSVNQS